MPSAYARDVAAVRWPAHIGPPFPYAINETLHGSQRIRDPVQPPNGGLLSAACDATLRQYRPLICENWRATASIVGIAWARIVA